MWNWSFHLVVLQRTAKKCTKIYNARAQLLFCSLNLLFSNIVIAIVVVVILNSLVSTVKPKSYWDKTQMFLRWRSVCCLLSNVINDAIADSIPRILILIFLQPMERVTIIHDWVTTFIVVHDRFTKNGYALPVPHVLYRKMDLQWKPQSNLYKRFSRLYYTR